jgi:hypothetical protein
MLTVSNPSWIYLWISAFFVVALLTTACFIEPVLGFSYSGTEIIEKLHALFIGSLVHCDIKTEERAVTRLRNSKQLNTVTIAHATEERCFLCGPRG